MSSDFGNSRAFLYAYAHVTPAMLDHTADRRDGILERKAAPRKRYGLGYGPIRAGLRVAPEGRFVLGGVAGEEGFEPSVS